MIAFVTMNRSVQPNCPLFRSARMSVLEIQEHYSRVASTLSTTINTVGPRGVVASIPLQWLFWIYWPFVIERICMANLGGKRGKSHERYGRGERTSLLHLTFFLRGCLFLLLEMKRPFGSTTQSSANFEPRDFRFWRFQSLSSLF